MPIFSFSITVSKTRQELSKRLEEIYQANTSNEIEIFKKNTANFPRLVHHVYVNDSSQSQMIRKSSNPKSFYLISSRIVSYKYS